MTGVLALILAVATTMSPVVDEGWAHWYDGPGPNNADMTPFDPLHPQAAHQTLPLGTTVEVRSFACSPIERWTCSHSEMVPYASMILEIKDRGPYPPPGSPYQAMLDLTPGAAELLMPRFGYTDTGVAYGRVWVEVREHTPAQGEAPVPTGNLPRPL